MIQPSDQVLHLTRSQLSTRVGERRLIVQSLFGSRQPLAGICLIAFKEINRLFENGREAQQLLRLVRGQSARRFSTRKSTRWNSHKGSNLRQWNAGAGFESAQGVK